MNRVILLAMTLLATTTAASAHMGDHTSDSAASLITHFLGSSHLLLLAAALICTGLGLAALQFADRRPLRDRSKKGPRT